MIHEADNVRLAEAAERVGRPVWWLRRYLHEHERRTGHAVLIRVGTGEKRPTYRVHMGRLRVTCPELFDTRDKIASALRDNAIVGREALTELLERVEDIDAKLGVLAEAVRRLVQQPVRR